MTGLVLCVLAFVLVYRASARGVGHGVGALLAVGYAYGITRARVADTACHFLFDVGTLALYAAQYGRGGMRGRLRSRHVLPWLTLLMGWPILLLLIPQQHFLIQLVGLRASIFFLPFVLVGSRWEAADLDAVARWVAAANGVAFAFACGEYVLGIERFFPRNAMTELIYRSTDVAARMHRIPATFGSAHSYAGTMVATLPFLLGRWHATPSRVEKSIFAAAIVASAIGVFMAGARLPVVVLFIELALIGATLNVPVRFKVALVAAGLLVAAFVARDERFQRFLTLRNTDMVIERVGWSVNMSFVDMLRQFPFGAGLGSAAGTSIPYFLESYKTTPPIGMENEYGRIALEQSVVGLGIWLTFMVRTLTRQPNAPSAPWTLGTRIMTAYVILTWGTGLIGTGMLTSIPQTPLLLLQVGLRWRARLPAAPSPRPPAVPAATSSPAVGEPR